MTSEFYSNECDQGISNSVYLLSELVLSTNIITAVISAILAAVIVRLFFQVKCRKRNKLISPTHSHNRSIQNLAEPLYQEVELMNNNLPINFSQNVAYQSTIRKQQ